MKLARVGAGRTGASADLYHSTLFLVAGEGQPADSRVFLVG